MAEFPGSEELYEFVKNRKQPTSYRFFTRYRAEIAGWSLNMDASTSATLHRSWVSRFYAAIKSAKGNLPSRAVKFVPKNWKSITEELVELRYFSDTSRYHGQRLVTQSLKNVAQRSVVLLESTQEVHAKVADDKGPSHDDIDPFITEDEEQGSDDSSDNTFNSSDAVSNHSAASFEMFKSPPPEARYSYLISTNTIDTINMRATDNHEPSVKLNQEQELALSGILLLDPGMNSVTFEPDLYRQQCDEYAISLHAYHSPPEEISASSAAAPASSAGSAAGSVTGKVSSAVTAATSKAASSAPAGKKNVPFVSDDDVDILQFVILVQNGRKAETEAFLRASTLSMTNKMILMSLRRTFSAH
ncbi:hypothetical protein DFQ30_008374 [Apophysomyces sp. BC1015]|nr:hypothetical protein DFQ30_008374 [Apophysomyces sp. BC1015]KAG0172927.1 hypothetical protein DFQ29_008184 [Apophysomyces sp. BC1021]